MSPDRLFAQQLLELFWMWPTRKDPRSNFIAPISKIDGDGLSRSLPFLLWRLCSSRVFFANSHKNIRDGPLSGWSIDHNKHARSVCHLLNNPLNSRFEFNNCQITPKYTSFSWSSRSLPGTNGRMCTVLLSNHSSFIYRIPIHLVSRIFRCSLWGMESRTARTLPPIHLLRSREG